jgi:hypothetical protein
MSLWRWACSSASFGWKPRTQLRMRLQRKIAYFDRLRAENDAALYTKSL